MKIYNFIISLKEGINKKYKKHLFKKYASIGNNVEVHPCANIKTDSSSTISIKGNNDILCSLVALSGGHIEVGEYTTIRAHSVIGSAKRIIIGDKVIISNNVHIYDNNNHPTSPEIREKMCLSGFYSNLWNWELSDSKEIIIEDNVWIGERSTILKGVTIGKGSVIGCDSVVTKDIPPYCIAAGNPAKIVKKIEPTEKNK